MELVIQNLHLELQLFNPKSVIVITIPATAAATAITPPPQSLQMKW